MPLFVRPRRIERRRRFVYVTRNTEYHVMDGICVAVRDRRSRTWRDEHRAVGHNLAGGIRIVGGALLPSLEGPALDEPIYFVDPRADDEQVITSRLTAIDRPQRRDLARYPAD